VLGGEGIELEGELVKPIDAADFILKYVSVQTDMLLV